MKTIFNKLFDHKTLSRIEAKEILSNITKGFYNDYQIAAFIAVYQMRSITLEELLGFRDALLEYSLPLNLSDYKAIDIVGTGGDHKNTFNISTAACFVVAASGYHVIKHGNYGSSSVSGSSNVMEQHGIRFHADLDRIKQSLDSTHMTFLHAPLFNQALKQVAGVRKALGVRTFFNALGPLVNPAKPQYNMLGVYNLAMARLYAYTYQQAQVNYCVVHNVDGYDEISLTANFKVISNAKNTVYQPSDLKLSKYLPHQLYGGETPEQAADIFYKTLSGEGTAAQEDVVVANAAFAIHTIDPRHTLETCVGMARENIRNGKVLATFKKYVALNGKV